MHTTPLLGFKQARRRLEILQTLWTFTQNISPALYSNHSNVNQCTLLLLLSLLICAPRLPLSFGFLAWFPARVAYDGL